MKKDNFKKPFEKPSNKNTYRRPIAGGYLIFFLTCPIVFLIIKFLSQGAVFKALVSALAICLYFVGGSFIRKGIYHQLVNKNKKWQRSSSFPWKVFGAISVGVGTAITSLFLAKHAFFTAIGFGLSALIGCVFVYGTDPRYSKPESISRFGVTSDEIIEALEEAEQKIQTIESSSYKISDLNMKNQLHRITSKAHDILHVIEEDPKDLRRARKFLKVYLDGTQNVIKGYVNVQQKKSSTTKLDDSFQNVLDTVEKVFNEQHQKLLENDILDLDVQIEVLETQLKYEGVT